MLFSRCQRGLMRVAAAALALGVTLSSVAVAKPRPGKSGSFNLMSSALLVFESNRVFCRVASGGPICATGSSTVGGGLWPKGSADQYSFAGGLQIAGIIDPSQPKSINGFAGDTAGAFFYNSSTGTGNGIQIQPIFSSDDASDVAAWPEAAKVPAAPDPSADIFDPTLQGRIAASQGDHWWVYWEGDPSQLTFRTHPLGILVESRSLAWNFPSGNEDVLYFIHTFYNVTSTNPADYAYIRQPLRDIILQQARNFQALNTAKFGVALPAGGYSINDIFVDNVTDSDVAQADINFASVNVPFALGFTYVADFSETTARGLGWTFDPAIFGSAPFFNGPGFQGIKYLRSPINPSTGQEVGLTVFGTFSRSSGSLQDPSDDRQLYRYMSAGLLPTDGACSVPNPQVNHICFVNISAPADMRFFESSGPFNLGPGQSGSIVAAYIFAAPVTVAGCPGVTCFVPPATSNDNLTILGDPARMTSGVNPIDIVTGYLGFTDANGDGKVAQSEFQVQPGSLLGKSLVAQAVFDAKFLLPFAPERPEFFLVPGNNQVTVVWAASPTETVPDPYFAVASPPTTNGAPNALYDPNFRGIDIEGYRVYRGRTSTPSELTLVGQFDFAPSPDGKGVFTDFLGNVNPVPGCAPELGVGLGVDVSIGGCGSTLQAPPPPGTPFAGSVDVDLVGTVTQVKPGDRVKLANESSQILPGKLDTAFVNITRGRLGQGVSTQLNNLGVPYIFIDRDVRNSLRYFYAVTSFDVNSIVSGPTSLESARTAKAVTPVAGMSNQTITSSLVTHTIGRGVAVDTVIKAAPTFDAATAKFSGPAQPANGGTIGFVGEFASSVIQPSQSGALAMRLDSLRMGLYSGLGSVFGGVSSGAEPTNYYMTVANGADSFKLTMPLQQSKFTGLAATGTPNSGVDSAYAFFEGLAVDPGTAQKYEGTPPFKLQGQATAFAGPAQELGGWGVGCRFGDFGSGADCQFNGSRWFDGPSPTKNETVSDPQATNCVPNAGSSGAPLGAADCGANLTVFNNAGALTGVTNIFQAQAYIAHNGAWRNLEWLLPTVKRAADFNVYWGAVGAVDSVIDVTHNVVVPFETYMGGGFGILNTSAGVAGQPDTRPDVGTISDIGCVEPFFTPSGLQAEASIRIPCAAAAATPLSSTAQLGPVAFFRNQADRTTAPPAADPGFVFYIAGDVFLMSMPALPAPGTVWALRSYAGQIVGAPGAYTFTAPTVRPFTAIGATQAQEFGVSSVVAAATDNDLTKVHTVPDPYYVLSKYESSTDQKILKFVGLPQDAIVRIYSASGILVRMLEHHGGQYSSTSNSQGSELDWDLRNRNNQVVASGVYFYHVEAGDARRVGRFTVVNFAQ